MAWNDINTPIADKGVNAARRYLAENKQITNDQCIFHDGGFEKIAANPGPFQLYIVSHGFSNSAEMASGDSFEESMSWTAKELATTLIQKGFPGNREARIKLCLCFSAANIQDPDFVNGVFAQMVAQQMYFSRLLVDGTDYFDTGDRDGGKKLQRTKTSMSRSANPFLEVFVGGFTVEVNWGKTHHYPAGDPLERAVRIYFRCKVKGERVTAVKDEIRPGVVVDDVHFREGIFKTRKPTKKWGKMKRPAHLAPKFAFFPFDYPAAAQ